MLLPSNHIVTPWNGFLYLFLGLAGMYAWRRPKTWRQVLGLVIAIFLLSRAALYIGAWLL